MPVDPMFWLATAAFAWGLSLASYRWFAVHNAWPMGEWQAHRPGLPIAIGVFAMLFALLFAIARGGTTAMVLPLFGVVCALAWMAIMRVGAQSALILAPLAVGALLASWLLAASHIVIESSDRTVRFAPNASSAVSPAATERERDLIDRDRGIKSDRPDLRPSSSR